VQKLGHDFFHELVEAAGFKIRRMEFVKAEDELRIAGFVVHTTRGPILARKSNSWITLDCKNMIGFSKSGIGEGFGNVASRKEALEFLIFMKGELK
jgi:hypothetical protein